MAGVQAGDRVALILPNCPQHIAAFYAILRLGAIVVEHNPLYTGAELRHMFEDHGAKVAIVWDKIASHITGLRIGIFRTEPYLFGEHDFCDARADAYRAEAAVEECACFA